MELSIFLKSLVRIFDIYSDDNIPENVNSIIDEIRPWNLNVNNYDVTEVSEGYLIEARIPHNSSETQGFELPGLPGLFVSFNREPGHSFIYFRVIVPPDRDDQFFIIKDLRLSISYRNTAIMADVSGGLKISVRGDIKVNSDFKFEFQSFTASCDQQLRLLNNDIFLRFRGFRFNFDEENAEIPFNALPESARKGIFCKKVEVGLGADNIFNIDRPISFAFRELFITSNGVSFKFHQHIYANVINEVLDPESELPCNILRNLPASITGIRGKVQDNSFEYFGIEGVIKLPILSIFARFDLGLDISSSSISISLRSAAPIEKTLGFLQVDIGEFELTGTMNGDSASLSGSARNIRVRLNPIDISLAETTFELRKSEEKDEMTIGIDPLPIPLFGFLRDAALTLSENKIDENAEDELKISGRVRWGDIKNRIGGSVPVLSNEDSVSVDIYYKKDPETGNDYVEVKIRVGLADPSAAWSFLPSRFRPSIRNAETEFTVFYESVGAFANANESSALSVSAGFSFELRLPDVLQLPPNSFFILSSGDEEGWMRVSMNVSTDLNNISTATLSLSDPVTLGINFPGLPQPEPPVSISLDSISFTTGQDAKATVTLEVAGSFRFLPLEFPRGFVMAEHLERLLGEFAGDGVAGTTKLSIRIKEERSEIGIECSFTNLSFEADVFDLIRNLSNGIAPPSEVQQPTNEVDLDIPVSFGLKGFNIKFGSLEEGSEDNFAFSVDFNFGILEISSLVSFALSDQECRIGFKNLSIPLRFPKFPLSKAEINAGSWNNVLNQAGSKVQALDQLLERLEGFQEAVNDMVDIGTCLAIFSEFEDRYAILTPPGSLRSRVDPQVDEIRRLGDAITRDKLRSAAETIRLALQRHTGEMKLKQALMVTADSIRGRLSDGNARANFHTLLSGVLEITDAVNGIFYQDTDLRLLLNASLVIPFNDPRNIAVEGGGKLTGTQPGDPLHSLEGIELGLGLSTERIYFFARSMGEPIPIRIGSYDAGSVSFTHFTIGYGFTRNSFSTSFGGKVNVSERLQNDVDTSDNLGIGFRLPSNTSLAFRFDIIIPPPPAPIPVPYIEFDLDMQKPGLVTVADPTICRPNWDGFQFIIQNVFRFGFKRVALSPFFGPLPIPNFRYAYDLSIGDKNNGLTIICDNFLVMAGLGTPPNSIPIPFFIEPSSPYYDNLCVHVQLAGFEMNFHLQRPLPNFSPLAVFEILGLLSDPMMPVNPRGPLANIVKVSLTDTYIRVPEWVTFLAPSLKEINRKEVNIVLNLGTVITAFQQFFALLQQMQQALEDADRSLRTRASQLAEFLEDPDLAKVLALVPPELRKLRAEADFGGFRAKVVLVITDASDTDFIKNAFRSRDTTGSVRPENNYRLTSLQAGPSPSEIENFRVRGVQTGEGQRNYDPANGINEIFRGIEFSQFSAADIDAFPAPRKEGLTGIVAAAMLRVFNQRYRFLGCIFDDGSFGMITAVEIEPLRLTISGIPVNLGLTILARLTLTGRRERNRYYASIAGESFAEWEPIPGVLVVTLGNRKTKTPVRVAIDGKGKFSVKGAAAVDIFNGAALIQGSIDADNDHCFVDGTFTYAPPISIGGKSLIFLQMVATTKIGPGKKFLLAGSAELEILEQPFTSVKARISDEGASLEFHYETGNWQIADDIEFPLSVKTNFKGDINIRQPGFSFNGKGELVLRKPGTNQELLKVNGSLELGYSTARKLFLVATGQLDWFRMNWIGGGLELASDRVRIFGDTRFVINLTPAGFNGLNFAAVSLQFEMQGSLSFMDNGDIDLSAKGKWLLGVSGAGENSSFPIASQQIDISANLVNEITLIQFSNLNFIPIQNVDVFVPTNKDMTIYSMDIDFGPVGTFELLMPVNLPGTTKWGKIPFIDPANWKPVSLTSFLASVAITVKLVCENWQPRLKVKVGTGPTRTVDVV